MENFGKATILDTKWTRNILWWTKEELHVNNIKLGSWLASATILNFADTFTIFIKCTFDKILWNI